MCFLTNVLFTGYKSSRGVDQAPCASSVLVHVPHHSYLYTTIDTALQNKRNDCSSPCSILCIRSSPGGGDVLAAIEFAITWPTFGCKICLALHPAYFSIPLTATVGSVHFIIRSARAQRIPEVDRLRKATSVRVLESLLG